ncbi:MAG: hypothetical protein ACE5G1_12640 [bacterium]
MNRKCLLSLIAIGAFVMGGFSEATSQARIIHVPVTSLKADGQLVVNARVDGANQRVAFMRLYFRAGGDESYEYIEMTESISGYVGQLSMSRFASTTMEYFMLAFLADQNVVTFPASNPYGNPLVVNIEGQVPEQPSEQPSTSTLPTVPQTKPDFTPELAQTNRRPLDQPDELTPVLILSPENGESFGSDEEVVIAASFLTDTDPINLSSIMLLLNGLDITERAVINENLLTYTASNLPAGRHQVIVQGHFKSGVPLPATIWSFEVTGKSSKNRQEQVTASFRGRVFAETRQENISRVGFTDNNIGGHLNGRYGATKYDARVFLTTRESRSFQPRNRFSFAMDLGPLGVTLGDAYPRFNDLMLWGKRVRGVYGRLHLGFINFDVVHGQTQRAVPATIQAVIDTSTGNPFQNFTGLDSTELIPTGTFRQNLLGARVSFGGGRHFQWGLNLLKVRDDTTSLKPGEFSALPQDNLVAGSDILIAFNNRRFEIRGSVAASLLSTDISGGPLSKKEVEDQFDVDLPFDPADFSKYFIINASTTPLDPRDLTSLAYNFSLRLNYFNNNFQFGYKSHGSQYVSLGNTLLRNNLRGFYFQDRMRLYKNKVYLNLGFENYDDNFNPDDENPITKLQTVSYGVSFFPGRGLPNLTLNMREHHRDNDVDTVGVDLSSNLPIFTDNRENNTTKDLTVQVNYDVNLLNLNHSVSVSYITSDRNDVFNTSRLLGVPSSENSSARLS